MKNILMILLLLPLYLLSADRYVSNEGDDTNSGVSPAAPWRTVAKVNGFSFTSGDHIYEFCCI